MPILMWTLASMDIKNWLSCARYPCAMAGEHLLQLFAQAETALGMSAGAGFTLTVSCLETVSTATCADSVGIVDGKATPHQLIYVVDLCPLQVGLGCSVHVYPYAIHIQHLIICCRWVFVETHTV